MLPWTKMLGQITSNETRQLKSLPPFVCTYSVRSTPYFLDQTRPTSNAQTTGSLPGRLASRLCAIAVHIAFTRLLQVGRTSHARRHVGFDGSMI